MKAKVKVRTVAEVLTASGAVMLLFAVIAITSPFAEEVTKDSSLLRTAVADMKGLLFPAAIGALLLAAGFYLLPRRS